jgi:hypothetical protein
MLHQAESVQETKGVQVSGDYVLDRQGCGLASQGYSSPALIRFHVQAHVQVWQIKAEHRDGVQRLDVKVCNLTLRRRGPR